uniref:Portal protein n=1 Tax=viral metagenome TaxID=1070528 RepID=A0A6H1ZG97_9ZZZZ
MGKSWEREFAKENIKAFKENARGRAPWERDAVRFDDFRYNKHFSPAEEKELLAFRQAPLPISITSAICDTAEALMTASKPIIKVAPIINPFQESKTEQSKKVAQKYNYLLQKSWYDSLGGLQYDRVVRDYTNVGHGFFYVVPRNEFGEFTVDIKHINWKYVYPHPQTKDPFYRDADNHVIAMEVSLKAGYKFVRTMEGEDFTYKQFEDDFIKGDLTRVGGTGLAERYEGGSNKNNKMMFIQRLVLEDQIAYIVIPKKETLNHEANEVSYKIYSELTDNLKALRAEGRISIREERRFLLTEYTSVGNLGYKIIYPIDEYNLIPMVYDHRDNPYPYGRIWYLYPLQRALNKFLMLAILNGSLMNANRILAEENSITNVNEWKQNFSTPGAFLTYKLPIPGQSKPPQIIESKPLSEAWLAMPRYLTYIMEYISGIFGVMMGDSQNTPDVFSTVASLQSAGGQKIKRRLAQADATLSQVGRVTGKFYEKYAPPNGFATVIDENGDMQEPETYNVLRVNAENNVEVDPNTDLSVGFRDVRFTTQGSNGFESGTEAALLTNLATQLKVPQLVPLILKRLNIGDVDKVIKNMDLVNQQGATIEQLQGAMKELESKSKILANQVQQKSFETETAKFKSELDKVLNDVKKQVDGSNGR